MNYKILKKHNFGIFSLVFLLIVFCTESANAQDSALVLASKLYNNSNFEEAITEYMRFIYFNPDNEKVGDVYHKIGSAYRNQKKWHEAIDAIRKSIAISSNDSIRDDRRISLAVIMIANANYSAAEFELLRISHFTNYSGLKRKANFFLGVCHLYTFKWKESQEAFSNYYSGSFKNKGNEIDSLFTFATNLTYKSPGAARWLSTFLPGSGQIYCGDWRNGINALVLNSLTSYLLINSLLERRFQDTFISFLTPFERYYRGNRYHAERIALLHNERLNETSAKKILEYIQHMESVPE